MGQETVDRLTDVAVTAWKKAGSDSTILFIVGGKKAIDPEQKCVLMSNTDESKECLVPARQECSMLYWGLVTKGVPKDQIIWEDQSDNTHSQVLEYENLIRELASEKSNLPDKISVTLVCHDLHLKRAKLLFRAQNRFYIQGVLTIPYRPDPSQPLNGGNWFQRLPAPLYWLLEKAVTARDYLKGWI
ncbi:MAG: YdcF family protein [Candidatus Berkelbacteria bacterium]|nr:YdcF family protein [Candidatus Berkelbacteria bacterium]